MQVGDPPEMPFEIRAHARYNPAASSRLNIVPGLVGTILTMTMLIFTALSNVFTLNDLDTSVQAVAKGAIIVVAVMLQQRVAARSRPT